MLYTKLSTLVKAVRLRYAVLFVVLLIALYWTGIHPWMTNWGSTAAERQLSLPGDDHIPVGRAKSTKAITIYASTDTVWQWLVQIGQDRGGYYTYTWLENLTGTDFRNANEIHPEWQQLAVGDGWRLIPVDYPFGLGEDGVVPVLSIEPGRVLSLEMFGTYVLLPIDEHTTRLLVRSEASPATVAMKMIVDPVVFTMGHRMLLGLKARAEGRPDAPALLMAIAWLGWTAMGVIVAGLFFSQRRRVYWIVLPIIASLPALLMSRDIQAGLAAFLATGITVLGFLFFGKNWWGSLLIIGSSVLLTLLLAPEAFSAVGIAFALILLAAFGLVVAARPNTRANTKTRLVTPT